MKKEMKIMSKIERILEKYTRKANNEFGYEIDIEGVVEINNLGYKLSFEKEGIKWFK
jgi:hypothetical protein